MSCDKDSSRRSHRQRKSRFAKMTFPYGSLNATEWLFLSECLGMLAARICECEAALLPLALRSFSRDKH